MAGYLQILTVLAVLLNTFLSSRALPINNQDGDVNALTLIATGLLNQEKRLQAVEQRLLDLSSAPTDAVGRAQVRGRFQLVQNREHLDIQTRMKYLEEDVKDNRRSTDHKLHVVYDQVKELQRRESADIRKLHGELEKDVSLLENEVNSTFRETEQDINTVDKQIDKVEMGVEKNAKQFNHLNNGFYRLIDYINSIDHKLKIKVYDLEDELKVVKKELSELKQKHEKEEKQPSVAPVGKTGGMQAYPNSRVRTMSNAEMALHEWMKEDQAINGDSSPSANAEMALREWMREDRALNGDSSPSANVQSTDTKPMSTSFEDLFSELENYNM